MTDENNNEMMDAEPPEMNTFEVTSTRVFEVDLPEEHTQSLMEQMDIDDPEEAVSQLFLRREKEFVEPQQKLLLVDVQANESSDD